MHSRIVNIFKKILIILLIAFFIIQFVRPERNNSGNQGHDITTIFPVPVSIQNILKVACNDCHSNTTAYPWYANIQPVAWWLNHHVEEGKNELNFSEFSTYRLYRQYHKLEEIIEVLEEDEMPIYSYTILHGNAALDDKQKKELIDWAKGLQKNMETTYPADSLINPKKRKN